MKTTIFARILIATLLPLVLIFSLVIFTINNVIYLHAANSAKELTRQAAKQTVAQAVYKLNAMAAAVQFAGAHLSTKIDYQAPNAETKADEALMSLMVADPIFHQAWLIFEPGVFPDGMEYYKTLPRESMTPEDVRPAAADPAAEPKCSPWLKDDLPKDKMFINILEDCTPEGHDDLSGAITYPVFSGQKQLGCVALGIHYKDIFNSTSINLGNQQKFMLLSREGDILYSSPPQEAGRSLLEYKFKDPIELENTLRCGATLLKEDFSPFFEKNSLIGLYPITSEAASQTFYLYLDIPIDELHAATHLSFEIIISASILGLVLLVFCIFFTARNIVRPIKRLTANFNKAAAGLDFALDGEDAAGTEATNIIELDSMQTSLQQMLEQMAHVHDLNLKAAQTRVEKEKILAGAQAKNQFFANMSHEIRTPMNAILGIAEILLHGEPLTEQQRRYVNDIKSSSDELLSTINAILDLSKLEAGKMPLNPTHFNLQAMLDNVVSLISYLADEKGLAFKYEPQGDIPAYLYGDDLRIRQVLLNVLSNAVKFTSEGSVTLRLYPEEHTLRFTVSDTSVGIKAESLPFLFEPFTQVDPVQHRNTQASGLGLSICKSLLELMGGSISVQSRYGEGSVFTVVIPKVPGDAAEPGQNSADMDIFYDSATRVLIVDDNEINLHVAAGMLKTLHGINADLASSGAESLVKVRETAYDLIFMDYMMPEMDGVQATARIRAMGQYYEDIPIVALTANAAADAKETMLANKMNDFLSKPIRKDELSRILFAWLPKDKRKQEFKQSAAFNGRPGPELSEPLQKLAALSIIDVSAGLDAIGGQQKAYEHVLALMRDKIPLITVLLSELMKKEQLRDLAIHVHGLKSSLANIGAFKLSEAAYDLEKAAVSENVAHCRELLPAFVERMQELYRHLEEALAENSMPAAKARGDAASLKINVQRLSAALMQHDYDNVSAELDSLAGKDYGPEIEAVIARVKKHIDLFEYSAAAAILAQSFPESRV